MSEASIICDICGNQRSVPERYAKKISGRYCSRKCAAQRLTSDDLYECKDCPQCAANFRSLKSRKAMFCSDACSKKARRVVGAKWRDPDQIKKYMADYAKRNRARLTERAKAWSLANVEKRKAISSKYAHKVRQAGIKHADRRDAIRASSCAASAKRVREIYARANHHCVYCAGKFRDLTMDHYVPVALGGGHNPGNLVPCCKACNSSKWMYDPEDWLEAKHGVIGLARVHVFLSRRKIIWELYPDSTSMVQP